MMKPNIETLAENDELMHLVVEASPNGMVLIDEFGNIVLVNSSIEIMFGYGRDDLINQPIEILVPQRFREHHPHLRKNYHSKATSRAMGKGLDLYGLHKKGTEFPVEIGLNPITTKNGVLVLAAIVDITERHKAQEMIRLAVEAAPNGMLLTNDEGTIVMANSTAERQFGYSREELVGQNITVLVPPRFQENHPTLRENYLRAPVSRPMGEGRDLYALHKNGTEFPVEIGLNPIDTAEGMMILASVLDITERKRQEEQLKIALKEKEVMLAEIHHRVKNNLQVIDSLIAMQLDSVRDETARFLLTDSQNRVKSMAIIHQTLYQSNDFSCVDIATVISSLVANLAQTYGLSDRSPVKVELELQKIELPLESSIPLGLIVNELISNAMKHAFPDGRPGEIRVFLGCNSENQIMLKIMDDGVGLTKTSGQGDSLGLRLVHTLADQLEADLDTQYSNPTCFSLQFLP